MRSVLGKAVRKRFAERLGETLPEFREIKTKNIPSVCRLYGTRTDSGVTLYLMLQLHRNRDWFTIELGWSRSGDYPSVTRTPESLDQAMKAPEMSFRLGRLWAPQRDVWWEFVPRVSPSESTIEEFMTHPPMEQALRRLDDLLEDAIRHIITDAMPYLRKVADSHRGA